LSKKHGKEKFVVGRLVENEILRVFSCVQDDISIYLLTIACGLVEQKQLRASVGNHRLLTDRPYLTCEVIDLVIQRQQMSCGIHLDIEGLHLFYITRVSEVIIQKQSEHRDHKHQQNYESYYLQLVILLFLDKIIDFIR